MIPKIPKLTHRKIVSISGLSLDQEKRCSRRLFSIDPEAGQAGGVRREFSLDQAFAICLFGMLIENFGFDINKAEKHARGIYEAIWPIVGNDLCIPPKPNQSLRDSFLPSTYWENPEAKIPDAVIEILPDRYLFRIYTRRPERQGGEIVARFIERHVPFDLVAGLEEDPLEDTGAVVKIPIAAILMQYLRNVRALVS